MPDQLNKQSVINLLIDSPLREPIKINLIDIVNNTADPDLPKVYSTITKELEIFQKATERRMKLAEETIAKLSGVAPTPPLSSEAQTPSVATSEVGQLPPTPPVAPTSSEAQTPPLASGAGPLTVPPLDLPPMPTLTNQAGPAQRDDSLAPVAPLAPLGAPAPTSSTDEDALAEIQKELDSLKTTTAAEVTAAATPTTPPVPAQ